MRWQYCAQPPDRNLLFGYGPAYEIKRRLLTFWHSVKFLVDYASIEGFSPTYGELHDDLRPLDRWLVARTGQLVAEATQAYDAFLSYRVVDAFEGYVEDLSNWYIRRSRRRFWGGEHAALATLWWSIVQSLRVIAPVAPFLAEHLWRNLVPDGAPESVHLAGWPDVGGVDQALLDEVAEVRRVVELGRQARASHDIKLRQPLRKAVVYGTVDVRGHADEILDELRVKEVVFEQSANARRRFKPNLPVLGPRLGRRLPAVREALGEGRYQLRDDGVLVDGEVLAFAELLEEREPVNEGWAVAADGDVSVEIDPELDDELRREGRVLDLIRTINVMRKDAGLAITDRIVVTLASSDADLVSAHADRIKQETLAVDLRVDGGTLRIEKV